MANIGQAKTLLKVGDILNILAGLSIILVGVPFAIKVPAVWLFLLVPAFLIWWTHVKVKKAIELAEQGKYAEARGEVIIPAILDLFVTGFLPGLLLLIGYVDLPKSNEVVQEKPAEPVGSVPNETVVESQPTDDKDGESE